MKNIGDAISNFVRLLLVAAALIWAAPMVGDSRVPDILHDNWEYWGRVFD